MQQEVENLWNLNSERGENADVKRFHSFIEHMAVKC